MQADPSLQRTIEELQGGISTEENFQILFRRFRPTLNRFFERCGVSPDDCRDLTQETFLRIYSGIGSFRREARFESWLFKIATNVYRKRLRWRSADKRAGQEFSLEEVTSPEHNPPEAYLADKSAERPNPAESLLLSESRRRLLGAVDALPDRMRECWVRRVLQGLTYEEIGVVMRLSSDTVRSHL